MDSRITSSRSRPSNLNTDSDGGSDPSPPSGGWSCWIGAWCRTATARACSKACRPPPKPLGIGPTCSARSRSSLPCTASARRRPGAKLIRMDFSKRVAQLPTYPMEKLPAIKRRLIEQGVDVIDVGAGDADFPPPDVAVKALTRALQDPAMSRYAFQLGLPAFREAAAAYMQRRFGVAVDPFKELHPLLGSKEGIAHLAAAVLDPGDVAIVPGPGSAVYHGGTVLADGEPYLYNLTPRTDFLLELDEVPAENRWAGSGGRGTGARAP